MNSAMDKKGRTLYCGNLSENVTEDLLHELFLQAGPLECVSIPKDKDGNQRNYGFITFKHEVSVPYAVALMKGVSLFGKQLRLELRTGSEPEFNPYLEQLDRYQMWVANSVNFGQNPYSNFGPPAMRNPNFSVVQYPIQYGNSQDKYRQMLTNGAKLQFDSRFVQIPSPTHIPPLNYYSPNFFNYANQHGSSVYSPLSSLSPSQQYKSFEQKSFLSGTLPPPKNKKYSSDPK